MTEHENRVARMHFDTEESILYITALPGVILDLESVKEHFAMISELTGDADHYALIDSTNSYTSTPEAIAYSAKPEVLKGRKAAAYFHPNLANRYNIMLVQIKMRGVIPSCAFRERDEALLWLRSLKEVMMTSR